MSVRPIPPLASQPVRAAPSATPVFNVIPPGWLPPQQQDMTQFWKMVGLQEPGVSYYTAAVKLVCADQQAWLAGFDPNPEAEVAGSVKVTKVPGKRCRKFHRRLQLGCRVGTERRRTSSNAEREMEKNYPRDLGEIGHR